MCHFSQTLTACFPLGSVEGGVLPIDKLKGTKPTKKIDLSFKKLHGGALGVKPLGVASAIIIASCIKGNGVLKELKCAAAPYSVRFCVSAH